MAEADPSQKVIAVVGPTAVGKSLLAEEIAVRLGGEIVSADSMQVYRRMDIGTAKTPVEHRRVAYHCVDIVEPGVAFSAALYQRHAREAIARIARRGRLPVFVGGTGLYIRAALDDWSFPWGETLSPLREHLEARAATEGAEKLHAHLAVVDPQAAALIHPANVRRTIRAIEMAEEGASYALQAQRFSERQSVYDARLIGLTMDRELLYARIDDRVDAMIDAGLLDEVRTLLDSGFRKAITSAQAIGYKELVPVIEQGVDLDEAVSSIKQASRRYAKRQMTWFRSDDRIAWVDVTDRTADRYLDETLQLLESLSLSVTAAPARGTWRIDGDRS